MQDLTQERDSLKLNFVVIQHLQWRLLFRGFRFIIVVVPHISKECCACTFKGQVAQADDQEI